MGDNKAWKYNNTLINLKEEEEWLEELNRIAPGLFEQLPEVGYIDEEGYTVPAADMKDSFKKQRGREVLEYFRGIPYITKRNNKGLIITQ